MKNGNIGNNVLCTWTEDYDGGVWETQCGQCFTLLEGTPEDNNFSFCCFCGKPMKEIPKIEEEDEDD